MRDADQKGDIICTLCGQPEEFDDDGNNDYKLTIGHINYPSSEYRHLRNSNDEVNLTPQHYRCNRLLEGSDFYDGSKDKLLETLKKNIEFSKSKKMYNLEFARQHSMTDDPSSVQNRKSKIYDSLCAQYLTDCLDADTGKISWDAAVHDIEGICMSKFRFGNSVSVARHLKKLCSRFYIRYVTEEDENGIDYIRKMRPDEKQKMRKILDKFKTDKSLHSDT